MAMLIKCIYHYISTKYLSILPQGIVRRWWFEGTTLKLTVGEARPVAKRKGDWNYSAAHSLLKTFHKGPPIVRTQISLVVAALVVHVPAKDWGDAGIVNWVRSEMNAHPECIPSFLELLRVLPEVALEILTACLNINELREQVLEAFPSWLRLRHMIPASALASHSLVLTALSSLISDILSEASVNVISELIHYSASRKSGGANAQIPVIQLIVPQVMSLKPQIRDSSKDEEDVKAIARLFADVGDSYLELIANGTSLPRNSEHPLAKSIVENAKKLKEDEENPIWPEAQNFESITGYRIKAMVRKKEILVGKKSLMTNENIVILVDAEEMLIEAENIAQTGILVAMDREIVAVLAISDPLKPNAREVISILKSMKIKSLLVTGDNWGTAKSIAKEVGIDMVIAEAKPHEHKAEKVKELQDENHDLAYKLEQSQIQEQLKMQYECSSPYTVINELENHVENLENQLKMQSNELSESLDKAMKLENQVKDLEEEVEKRAREFEDDLETITNAKVAEEKRAIQAEENLRKMRWKNGKIAGRLQEDLKKLSIQMASEFEDNEKSALKALTQAVELRRQKSYLEDMLKKSKEEIQFVKDQCDEKMNGLLNKLTLKDEKIVQIENEKKHAEETFEKKLKKSRISMQKLETEKIEMESAIFLLRNETEKLMEELKVLRRVKDEKERSVEFKLPKIGTVSQDESEKQKLKKQMHLKGELKKKDFD